MTKDSKTAEKERAEIVVFCIEHGKDYLNTCGVSYRQIHAWHESIKRKGLRV